MSDLVSRKDAINALSMMQGIVAENGVRKGISMAWQQINGLPSAQPERPKGEWVECVSSEHWKCNQCGDRAPMYWDDANMSYAEWLSPYCPNCGADMRGEEDDD